MIRISRGIQMSKILLSILLITTFGISACNDGSTSKESTNTVTAEQPTTADLPKDSTDFQSSPIDIPAIPEEVVEEITEEPISEETSEEDEVVSEAPVESKGKPEFIAPQCPKISSNFNKALDELKKHKNEILDAAGCETIAGATKRLEDVVTKKRKVYETVVKKYKKGAMLSGAEASALEEYAAQVSEAAAGVLDLMKISDCSVVRKKKPQIAKAILGITFDAVGGLGEFLGPYGAPLSIGITALKGVVNGLFKHSKNTKGYKFAVSEEGRDQAVVYTQNLCLFYNFKNEAEVLLNASDRRGSYLNLLTHLNSKIDSLTSPGFCNGCEILVDMVDSFEEVSPVAKQLVDQINKDTKLNLGTHMLDALQTRMWVESQMEKLEIEEDSFQESIGPAILGAELEDLENFLIYRESADFMSWINDEASSSYKGFTKHANKWTAEAFADMLSATGRRGGVYGGNSDIPYPMLSLRKHNSRNNITLYGFKELLLKDDTKLPKNSMYNDKDLVEAKYNKSIKTLKNVNRFIGSHNEYCNFFKLTGYYDAIYKNCNNRKINSLNDAFLVQTLADPNLSDYLQKDKEDKERVTKMSNGLEEWSKHLDKLFGKWDRIQSIRIQSVNP